MIRKADEFETGSNFLAWSRSIARYEILAARRRKFLAVVPDTALETLEASCPEEFAGEERMEALRRCVEALAPGHGKSWRCGITISKGLQK